MRYVTTEMGSMSCLRVSYASASFVYPTGPAGSASKGNCSYLCHCLAGNSYDDCNYLSEAVMAAGRLRPASDAALRSIVQLLDMV